MKLAFALLLAALPVSASELSAPIQPVHPLVLAIQAQPQLNTSFDALSGVEPEAMLKGLAALAQATTPGENTNAAGATSVAALALAARPDLLEQARLSLSPKAHEWLGRASQAFHRLAQEQPGMWGGALAQAKALAFSPNEDLSTLGSKLNAIFDASARTASEPAWFESKIRPRAAKAIEGLASDQRLHVILEIAVEPPTFPAGTSPAEMTQRLQESFGKAAWLLLNHLRSENIPFQAAWTNGTVSASLGKAQIADIAKYDGVRAIDLPETILPDSRPSFSPARLVRFEGRTAWVSVEKNGRESLLALDATVLKAAGVRENGQAFLLEGPNASTLLQPAFRLQALGVWPSIRAQDIAKLLKDRRIRVLSQQGRFLTVEAALRDLHPYSELFDIQRPAPTSSTAGEKVMLEIWPPKDGPFGPYLQSLLEDLHERHGVSIDIAHAMSDPLSGSFQFMATVPEVSAQALRADKRVVVWNMGDSGGQHPAPQQVLPDYTHRLVVVLGRDITAKQLAALMERLSGHRPGMHKLFHGASWTPRLPRVVYIALNYADSAPAVIEALRAVDMEGLIDHIERSDAPTPSTGGLGFRGE